jgi:nicotinate dehydrogenase subunit B
MNELPANLQANPQLSQWIALHADGRVQVRSGKVELGQGITTALARIVAQELDVAPARITMVPASTAGAPNEGFTSGSLSVQDSGAALRQVCAETRAIYLQLAAGRLEASTEDLEIVDGEIRVRGASGLRTSYWELADPALLQRAATGEARAKMPREGEEDEALQRIDLPAKLLGHAGFLHDMELPGLLYGRMAHPPSPAAVLLEVDSATVEAMPGVVRVVRDGSFLAVVAQTELQALQALRKLKALARWRESESLPDMNDVPGFLRSAPAETTVVAEKGTAPQAGAHRVFRASYARPFLAHASIGPSCGVARFEGGRLEVWTHAQGVYPMQKDLALLLALPAQSITVTHVPGAGCYGHNGADDAAVDAALLARAVPGRPVQVVWSREDELTCAPFGAAMAVDLQATVDDTGRIVGWEHEVWSNGHSLRPGRMPVPVFHAAPLLDPGFPRQVAMNMPVPTGGGAERNSIPPYEFGQHRIVNHRVLSMPLRTSALRSLGAHCNVFAAEGFIDEIARAMAADPLEFRLRHLDDPRGREVLEQAADMAGWRQRVPREGEGMGIGYARYKHNGAYCAAIVQVEVQQEIRVRHVWLAVDVGRIVHADGVRNQVEGGAIQTLSWVLKEAVQFDRTRVLSNAWTSYPILRFSEVPAIEIALLDRPHEKSMGAGEPTHGPLAAALGNAVAEAAGVRVREMPLTWDRVQRAALSD